MRASSDHILTSHAGSLPRPDDLIEANRAREAGETTDEDAFQETLQAAVSDVVGHQKELGIDVPGDGEFGKSVGSWGQLRRVVELCVPAAGRARARRAEPRPYDPATPPSG